MEMPLDYNIPWTAISATIHIPDVAWSHEILIVARCLPFTCELAISYATSTIPDQRYQDNVAIGGRWRIQQQEKQGWQQVKYNKPVKLNPIQSSQVKISLTRRLFDARIFTCESV
jgi:hypothetical protein